MTRTDIDARACAEHRGLTRRNLLTGTSASLAMWGLLPRHASAARRDPRLLVMVLRGGLDGLALAAPVGDPDYQRLRGRLALAGSGAAPALALDSTFSLNPSMPRLHARFRRKEALVIHAVATPYRGRSHFDGQDVLESGLGGVGRSDTGWLNRALAEAASAGRASAKGLAVGAVVPLVMKGAAPTLSWVPRVNGLAIADSTVARLMDLYAESDPALARAFADGGDIDRIGGGAMAAPRPAGASAKAEAGRKDAAPPPAARAFRDFIETAEAAARFMSAADGPRIGALSYNGWDTHANAGVVQGRLANHLAGLDAAIEAFAEGMGTAWKDTVVAVVTEFGRTARANGTDGTDHGTATAVLLVGGAVNGGRVVADWPGLSDASLHERRDLKPTRDLRSVLKGLLRDHVAIADVALARNVFPESQSVAALDGTVT